MATEWSLASWTSCWARANGYATLLTVCSGAFAKFSRTVCLDNTRVGHNHADLVPEVAGALLPSLDGVAQQSVRQQSERTSEVAHLALSGVHQDDDSDSASDSGSESSFGGSVACVIEDAIEDLKTDIQCLVDLGPRYKEPVRDKEAAKEEAAPLRTAPIWDPAEYLASRIRHRYPEGDAEFTRILGRANWDRLQRLYASKDANARDREAQQRPSLAQTQLSGPPATVKGTEFHDSGLGTSVKTPSSYAETVLSYQGAQGGSVKIPPVPPECLKGGTLVCDICGVMCSLPASNPKSFWKYVELRPLPTRPSPNPLLETFTVQR